jgi:hypothetical protein
MKGPTFGLSQQAAEAGGSLTWRRRVGREQPRQRRDGSAPPDDPGPASKTGRCTSAETSGGTPSSEANRLEPGGSGPGGSAREAAEPRPTDSGGRSYRRPGGHDEGLRRSRGEAAGEELGTTPVNRSAVNVGTTSGPPSPPVSQAGGGQARRRLSAPRWGGVPVVVRGRESRLQGEGGQRVRGCGTGTSGGRW